MPNSSWIETGSSISLVPVTTPIAPGSSINDVNYLTNANKIALMSQYSAELAIKTSLDTLAVTWVVSSAAYDAAVAAVSASLTSAGAPSNWATTWPDGTTSGPWPFIQTILSGDFAAVATQRTALQAAISEAQAGVAETAAITTAAAATLAAVPVTVSTLPTLPSSTYPSGKMVWNTTDGQLYRSTGSTWVVNTPSGANIAAGSITAAQLAVAALNVGGPSSQPTEIVVLNSSSAEVAEVGKMSGSGPWGNQYGAWFKNLGVGGASSASPNLWIDSLGNLLGANGKAIDLSGNVKLKNIITVPWVTANPVLASAWADLPELGAANPAMCPTVHGNPVLVGTVLSFNVVSAAGVVIGLGITLPMAYSPTSAGPPPAVTASITGVGGSGATAILQWMDFGPSGTGTWEEWAPQLLITSGGSGYTSATCTLTITALNGCKIAANSGSNNWPNSSTSGACTISGAGNASVPLQVRVLANSLSILGPVTLTTDGSGNANYSGSQITTPAAGTVVYEVQAMTSSGKTVTSTTRSFTIVELG